MRRKAIAAWVLLAFAMLFGFLGRATEADFLYFLSGLGFLSALGIAVSYLPFWTGFRDRVPPMPGLFPRVPADQWDSATGSSAPPPARRRK